jgi:hypothetical protein
MYLAAYPCATNSVVEVRTIEEQRRGLIHRPGSEVILVARSLTIEKHRARV